MEALGQFLCVFTAADIHLWKSRIMGEITYDIPFVKGHPEPDLSAFKACFVELEQGKHEVFLEWIHAHRRADTLRLVDKFIPELPKIYAKAYATYFYNIQDNRDTHQEMEQRILNHTAYRKVLEKDTGNIDKIYIELLTLADAERRGSRNPKKQAKLTKEHLLKRAEYNSVQREVNMRMRCLDIESLNITRDREAFKVQVSRQLEPLFGIMDGLIKVGNATQNEKVKRTLKDIVTYLDGKMWPKREERERSERQKGGDKQQLEKEEREMGTHERQLGGERPRVEKELSQSLRAERQWSKSLHMEPERFQQQQPESQDTNSRISFEDLGPEGDHYDRQSKRQRSDEKRRQRQQLVSRASSNSEQWEEQQVGRPQSVQQQSVSQSSAQNHNSERQKFEREQFEREQAEKMQWEREQWEKQQREKRDFERQQWEKQQRERQQLSTRDYSESLEFEYSYRQQASKRDSLENVQRQNLYGQELAHRDALESTKPKHARRQQPYEHCYSEGMHREYSYRQQPSPRNSSESIKKNYSGSRRSTSSLSPRLQYSERHDLHRQQLVPSTDFNYQHQSWLQPIRNPYDEAVSAKKASLSGKASDHLQPAAQTLRYVTPSKGSQMSSQQLEPRSLTEYLPPPKQQSAYVTSSDRPQMRNQQPDSQSMTSYATTTNPRTIYETSSGGSQRVDSLAPLDYMLSMKQQSVNPPSIPDVSQLESLRSLSRISSSRPQMESQRPHSRSSSNKKLLGMPSEIQGIGIPPSLALTSLEGLPIDRNNMEAPKVKHQHASCRRRSRGPQSERSPVESRSSSRQNRNGPRQEARCASENQRLERQRVERPPLASRSSIEKQYAEREQTLFPASSRLERRYTGSQQLSNRALTHSESQVLVPHFPTEMQSELEQPTCRLTMEESYGSPPPLISRAALERRVRVLDDTPPMSTTKPEPLRLVDGRPTTWELRDPLVEQPYMGRPRPPRLLESRNLSLESQLFQSQQVVPQSPGAQPSTPMTDRITQEFQGLMR